MLWAVGSACYAYYHRPMLLFASSHFWRDSGENGRVNEIVDWLLSLADVPVLWSASDNQMERDHPTEHTSSFRHRTVEQAQRAKKFSIAVVGHLWK